MKINLIVAASDNDVISIDGNIPWNIPEDMRRFRRLTTGLPVVMGLNTWYSLPVKPLVDRPNFVVSSRFEHGLCAQSDGSFECHSFFWLLRRLSAYKYENVWVIGGQNLLEQAEGIADRLYLTRVHQVFEQEGDYRYFHTDKNKWELIEAVRGSTHSFLTYRKK